MSKEWQRHLRGGCIREWREFTGPVYQYTSIHLLMSNYFSKLSWLVESTYTIYKFDQFNTKLLDCQTHSILFNAA